MDMEGAREVRRAVRRSATLATARDVALDVFGRWRSGGMGRGRWLILGPLMAVLALAAAKDVADAQGTLDLIGRTATALAAAAVFLNVAVKRVRDLGLWGWPGALGLHGVLGVAFVVGALEGVLGLAYALAMFLLPGAAARAAWRAPRG